MTQRIRIAVLACDWNGTLVDDADRALAATNHVLESFGLKPLPRPAFRQLFKLPLDLFFRENHVPELHLDSAIDSWNDQLASQQATLRAGARELLQAAKLKQVPVGVISAARTDVVEHDATQLQVLTDLTFVQGGVSDKGQVLADLVGRSAGPVGYLGDTEHDMLAAIEGGAVPLAIRGGYNSVANLESAGAEIVIDDLGRLGAMLVSANGRGAR